MRKFKYWMMALAICCGSAALVSCDEDADNTTNPAEDAVGVQKTKDTAILLCTFGSTFMEPVSTYDATIAAYEEAFPDADVKPDTREWLYNRCTSFLARNI